MYRLLFKRLYKQYIIFQKKEKVSCISSSNEAAQYFNCWTSPVRRTLHPQQLFITDTVWHFPPSFSFGLHSSTVPSIALQMGTGLEGAEENG